MSILRSPLHNYYLKCEIIINNSIFRSTKKYLKPILSHTHNYGINRNSFHELIKNELGEFEPLLQEQ